MKYTPDPYCLPDENNFIHCNHCREAMTTENLSTPQPPPKPGTAAPTWELVIADMKARDDFGRAKYGTPLRSDNGRDHLVDAYQEALDLCVYLRAAIEAEKSRPRWENVSAKNLLGGLQKAPPEAEIADPEDAK